MGFLNNKGSCKTKTQVLSANVEFGAGSPLIELISLNLTIMEKEGQKIALIGLTIANKLKMHHAQTQIPCLRMKSPQHKNILMN